MEFFRRHARDEEHALTARLDSFEEDLAALPETDRRGAVGGFSLSLSRDLRPIVEGSQQAATELHRIVTELTAAPHSALGAVVNSGIDIHHNKVRRDLNFGGHTNIVGEQR
ncbi:hypothetical protein [Streptomyces hygroscopicus]|uniref:hypothetical protein n=1 Tax=Streptomyces hygroscopicus TaxID=1912 RepID=UPI000767046B|nr:hypothetical protein [Streptomyces hygroscopicus]